MAKRTTSAHEKLLAASRAESERSLQSLRRQLDRLVADASDDAETDFSEEGGDPDGSVIERDRIRSQISETEEHLEAIARAEAALAEGTYGTCRVCGEQIPEERLEVLPQTLLCVRCKAAGHAA